MSRPQEHRVTWYATHPDELHDLAALQYAERAARYAIAQAESLAADARGYLAQLYTRAQQILVSDYQEELYFTREPRYNGIYYVMELRRVYSDKSIKPLVLSRQQWGGKERWKALAALKEFQKCRPLTPCHIDVTPKSWEKR